MHPDEIRRTDQRFKPSVLLLFAFGLGVVLLVIVKISDRQVDVTGFVAATKRIQSLNSFSGSMSDSKGNSSDYKYLAPNYYVFHGPNGLFMLSDGKWVYSYDGKSRVSVAPAAPSVDPVVTLIPTLSQWFGAGAPVPGNIHYSGRSQPYGDEVTDYILSSPPDSPHRNEAYFSISRVTGLPVRAGFRADRNYVYNYYNWDVSRLLSPADFDVMRAFPAAQRSKAVVERNRLTSAKIQAQK